MYFRTRKSESGPQRGNYKAGKQQQELEKLVTGFTKILDDYDKARPALLSREDVLRGFFQKTKEALERELKPDLREALTNAINCEYCKLRKVECCKQTLEDPLTCKVPLLRAKEEADAEAKRAGEALREIKDLGVAIVDKRFKELSETIQQKITEAWQSQEISPHVLPVLLGFRSQVLRQVRARDLL